MNRKRFLQLLAGASMAVGAAPFGAGSRARARAPRRLKHWVWSRGDFSDLEPWKARLACWRAAGVDAVLFNTGDAETLARLVSAASLEGLEAHAWIATMMRGGMETTHPEWYAVNGRGQSTATDPPYVDYYKFLCPVREPVQRHLVDHVRQLAAVDGLASVHLDYIRYPDVILPVALWPTYGLVQDREYPEFDYCYCEVCRDRFRQQTGVDPLTFDDPGAHEPWVKFRHDAITDIVTLLAQVAHDGGKQITAAVFPTPSIARALVRQDWPRWPVDAVLPMLYHSFYQEPVEWIESSTRDGVDALSDRIPLYAGLYVPELDPDQLAAAARHALAGGAAGVSLFHGNAPSEEHWQRLARVLRARP